MLAPITPEHLRAAAERMAFPGPTFDFQPLGSGHINDTFSLRCALPDGERRYVLQRVNHTIFDVERLMENVVLVTDFLRRKVEAEGLDPDRRVLTIIPTKTGETCWRDPDGSYWRAYLYTPNAVSYDRVTRPELFYESAVGFGQFQRQLDDFPADRLFEILPDFHNTPKRLRDLRAAAEADVVDRVKTAREELAFVRQRAQETGILLELHRQGRLPLRVTHNDTKLNNALFDRDTGKVTCIIDLDTVMPGLSLYDFGDAIRFGAATADEDERDLNKVHFDLDLFSRYTTGYLDGCGDILNDWEIEMLPMGAKLMTLECGIRFLTDYFAGDVYFHTERPAHNLDRCRTQFRLVREMEEKWDDMRRIVAQQSYRRR